MTVTELMNRLRKCDPKANVLLCIYEPDEEAFDYTPDGISFLNNGDVRITAPLNDPD